MTFAETFFLIQIIIVLGIFFLKMYNVMKLKIMKEDPYYNLVIAIISFIGFIVFYGFGFFTFLINYEETLYSVLFNLESLLLIMVVFFFIVELFYYLASRATEPIKPYMSDRDRRY